MNDTPGLRTLSVTQWAELINDGASPSVKTTLNGISMQPLIRKGRDVVTIVAVNRPIKRGDVVLFRRADGEYVVHRVRRLCGDMIITLGDNCWKEDSPPIGLADIKGLAVQVQRGKLRICLDSCLSRAAGRCWMACHEYRILLRRMRGAAIRRIIRVIKWKQAK